MTQRVEDEEKGKDEKDKANEERGRRKQGKRTMMTAINKKLKNMSLLAQSVASSRDSLRHCRQNM